MLRARFSWKLVLSLGAALLVAGGGGVWWYRSRPAARIQAAQDALRRGDWEEAQRLLDALAAAGHRDEAWLLQGEVDYRTGRPLEAIRELNKIQSEGPVRVQAAALGGWCFLELHNYGEALRHFQYALTRDPDNLAAHRGMARVYYHQGALAFAEEHLDEVTRLDPNNGEAWQALGVIHKDIDRRRSRAVQCFEEALRRELSAADRDAVRFDLAGMYAKMGNPAAALKLLDEFDPQTLASRPALLALRIECLEDQQRVEAWRLLERNLKDHPQAAELLRVRAKLALHAEKYAEAVPDLERLLQADRHDYLSRLQLSQALTALGRPAEAAEQRRQAEASRKLWDELTRLNREAIVTPWDAELQQRIADLCVQLDQHGLATMWRRAALASAARK